MAVHHPSFVPTIDELPPQLAAHLHRFAQAQQDGRQTDGDPLLLMRRYTLDDGSIYLPEVDRPPNARTVFGLFLAIGGLVALLAGVALGIDGHESGAALGVLGVAMIIWSISVLAKAQVQDVQRRAGVEVLGLYLLPDLLIMRRKEGLWLFPAECIIAFDRVSTSSDSQTHIEVLRFREQSGEVGQHRIVKGHYDELRDLMSAWLASEQAAAAATHDPRP